MPVELLPAGVSKESLHSPQELLGAVVAGVRTATVNGSEFA